MKILLFMANGVEMIEASAFIDVFGWHRDYCDGDIKVVTCGINKTIISTFDIPIEVDVLIDDINIEDCDALALPGGFGDYGFYDDAYSEDFIRLIRKFNNQNKIIASICVGALPLGKSGILKGRNATTYHLMNGRRQKQLKEFGVNIVNQPIVVDENIITSWCPSTAVGVALKLLELLTNSKDAESIRELMGY